MPAQDLTGGNERKKLLPGRPFLITPSDSADSAFQSRAIYATAAGAVSVQTMDGATVVIPNLAANIGYPIECTRVNSTGTTATGIWGIA